jgi:hypothetical protein
MSILPLHVDEAMRRLKSNDNDIGIKYDRLFRNYKSQEEFDKEIEDGRIYFVKEVLGIESDEVAVEILNRVNKDTLTFYKGKDRVYGFIICGKLDAYINKAEFIEYLEDTFNIRIKLVYNKESADVIVSDTKEVYDRLKGCSNIFTSKQVIVGLEKRVGNER